MLKNSKTYFFLYTLLNALALAGALGCRKDVKAFHDYPASLANLDPIYVQIPNQLTQTVFNLIGPLPDTVLITPSGVRVYLTDTEHLFANADNANPTPCSTCQTLKVEITEVFRKGDMIARSLPGSSADGRALESDGMIRVEVWCNGQSLTLLPGKNLKIQLPNTVQKTDLLVYDALVHQDSVTAWSASGQQVYLADWVSPQTGEKVNGYEVIATHTGWINCAREIQGTLSNFCIDLPTGFSGVNTQAFIVFSNLKSVVRLTADVNDQKYCFPNAPVGYPVKLITITQLGNSYWLGQKVTEIGTNATVDFVPQQTDEQGILTFLKNL